MKTYTVLACAASLALSFTTASAQMGKQDKPLPELTNEQLESEYLACEREAGKGLLDVEIATHCSIVYEAFKARAFDGDFERMVAWWQQRQGSVDPLEAP